MSYPRNSELYGIPERINTFCLKDTIDTYLDYEYEPYRLYTADHFDDLYKFHSLYGSIPIMHARAEGPDYNSRSITMGLLWANSSDTFVDILHTE